MSCERVTVVDHPMVQHKLSKLRNKETSSKDFRALVRELAMFEGYEATRDLELEDVEVETPICKTTCKQVAGKKMVIVPILRAGLGMVDGLQELMPSTFVGHLGMYRDPETHEPHVREGLGAPYEHAVFPFVFGIPDRPRPVERRHNLIFYGGSDKRVQIEQVGCLYPAEGMREIETHRKSLEGGDHSVVKPRFALSYTVGHIETRRTAYIVMHDVSPWSDSSRLTAWRYTSAFISAQ